MKKLLFILLLVPACLFSQAITGASLRYQTQGSLPAVVIPDPNTTFSGSSLPPNWIFKGGWSKGTLLLANASCSIVAGGGYINNDICTSSALSYLLSISQSASYTIEVSYTPKRPNTPFYGISVSPYPDYLEAYYALRIYDSGVNFTALNCFKVNSASNWSTPSSSHAGDPANLLIRLNCQDRVFTTWHSIDAGVTWTQDAAPATDMKGSFSASDRHLVSVLVESGEQVKIDYVRYWQ